MAMMTARGISKLLSLAAAFGFNLALGCGLLAAQTIEPKTAPPAAPTSAPPAAQPLIPAPPPGGEAFLRIAHSSAVLQRKAAGLAASRETKVEVRAFAQKMVDFRREQIAQLHAIAREHMLAVSPVPELEHRAILENLEPLDFLALSRRYAEMQVQALEQELQVYAAGENSADEWVRTLSQATGSNLRRLLEEGRQVLRAVGP